MHATPPAFWGLALCVGIIWWQVFRNTRAGGIFSAATFAGQAVSIGECPIWMQFLVAIIVAVICYTISDDRFWMAIDKARYQRALKTMYRQNRGKEREYEPRTNHVASHRNRSHRR